eukprot:TRINITY_DN18153_c0_g1_i1.p1 TRINITY_DN18153_c0_g1~~TRINITY_DN18153_c0_g1_i1.p1  ORF type:complete len:354 (+),score=115.23 TRINITY_DN18153_c0_g1_i1:136-1197(+)
MSTTHEELLAASPSVQANAHVGAKSMSPLPSPAPTDKHNTDPAGEVQSSSTARAAVLSHKDHHHIHDLFTSFDDDGSGKISRAEVINVFPGGDYTNKALTVDTAAGVVTFDANGDDHVEEAEWLAYFAAVKDSKLKGDEKAWKEYLAYVELNAPMSPRQKYHLSEIFKMYDSNKDDLLDEAEVRTMREAGNLSSKTKRKFEAAESKLSKFYQPDSKQLTLKGFLDWCSERRHNRGFWDLEDLINDMWGYKVAALCQTELEVLEAVFRKLSVSVDGAPSTVSLLILGLSGADSSYSKAELLQRAATIKLTEGNDVLAAHQQRWEQIRVRIPESTGARKPPAKGRCCGGSDCVVQ